MCILFIDYTNTPILCFLCVCRCAYRGCRDDYRECAADYASHGRRQLAHGHGRKPRRLTSALRAPNLLRGLLPKQRDAHTGLIHGAPQDPLGRGHHYRKWPVCYIIAKTMNGLHLKWPHCWSTCYLKATTYNVFNPAANCGRCVILYRRP